MEHVSWRSYIRKHMYEKPGRNLLIIATAVSMVVIFISLLDTGFYMYFFYILAGILYFTLAQVFGKHLYLYLILPLISIAPLFNSLLYNLDYNNNDGLNLLKMHPISIMLVVSLAVEYAILLHKKKFNLDLLSIFGILTIIIFSGVTFWKRGFNGFPILFSNYLGPIMLLVFLDKIKYTLEKVKVQRFITVFLVFAFFIGVYGIIEYIFKWNPLKDVYFKLGEGIIESKTKYRISTIIGNPLVNAFFFLCVVTVVNLFIKIPWLKYLMALFFSVVILVTGSRSIFILSIAIILFINTIKIKKDFYIKTVTLILTIVLLVSPLGETFVGRFNTSEGEQSAEARILLIQYFFKNLLSLDIQGIGADSENVSIRDDENQFIILENPWIMLYISVSYLLVIYLAFLFFTIKKVKPKRDIVFLLIGISTFNSFGVRGEINYMFFLVLELSILNSYFDSLIEKESKQIKAVSQI